MRSIKTILAATAALSLGVAPVAAEAASAPVANPAAAKLSVTNVRAATHGKRSQLKGGMILPVVLVAGIIAGGIIVATSDDDDSPDSL